MGQGCLLKKFSLLQDLFIQLRFMVTALVKESDEKAGLPKGRQHVFYFSIPNF